MPLKCSHCKIGTAAVNGGQNIRRGSACFSGPLRPKAGRGPRGWPVCKGRPPIFAFSQPQKNRTHSSSPSGPQNHHPTHRCRHCSPLLAALDFVFAIAAIPTSTTFAIISESTLPPNSDLAVDSLPVHRQTSHTRTKTSGNPNTFTRSPKLPQRR